MSRKTADKTIDLMARLQKSLAETPMWRCMECSYAHQSADMVTMHSANADHRPFFGTKADLEHHRQVVRSLLIQRRDEDTNG